jgi:hypothetical protein
LHGLVSVSFASVLIWAQMMCSIRCQLSVISFGDGFKLNTRLSRSHL